MDQNYHIKLTIPNCNYGSCWKARIGATQLDFLFLVYKPKLNSIAIISFNSFSTSLTYLLCNSKKHQKTKFKLLREL